MFPTPPYPIVFTGHPSDQRKFTAIHKFLQKFQAYRDLYIFSTMKSLTQQLPSHGPICSQLLQGPQCQAHGQSCPKKKHNGLPPIRDKFQNLAGEYASPVIPGWACANTSVNHNSVHSQQCIKGDRDSYYCFPDPGLITFANVERQKIYLWQLDHVLDSLVYHVSLVYSDALPVHAQKWCNLLGLMYKRDTSSTSNPGFQEVEELLGSCMGAKGVAVNFIPLPPQNDVPFDCWQGQELVWSLSELNFHAELLALDG
ncbi:hypothetical protein IW261DRAFT_1570581 [Armillaria novae-zelandiae]|uniref:Uncharacterized protein n=1 Tax=Armillaria novae-zelandiae TaxID=153914 RepID=A0AA39NW92_9AGAR|nr:hypothetical protein IW261DRAFT_1570581 [Armillaria novae-zelandiae]